MQKGAVMNGFPYFQFHVDRWLTGKISSFDLDEQGLYLQFCMQAWSNMGAFNICPTSVQRRFRKSKEWVESAITAFVDVGILSRDGGKHRIKFIDDQIADLTGIREKRSQAGKASAAARAAAAPPPAPPPETRVEERRAEQSSVLNCVQQKLNKCSTLVENGTLPQLVQAVTEYGIDEMSAANELRAGADDMPALRKAVREFITDEANALEPSKRPSARLRHYIRNMNGPPQRNGKPFSKPVPARDAWRMEPAKPIPEEFLQ